MGAAFALMLAIVVFAGARLWEEVKRLKEAPEDNVQWTLTQFELEFNHLQTAVEEAELGRIGLEELRLRYDLFYSRAITLSEGSVFRTLRLSELVASDIERILAFLEGSVGYIDGDDEALRAVLPEIRQQVAELYPHIRETSLEGLKVFGRMTEERRAKFVNALFSAVFVVVALIVALTLSLAVSYGRAADSERIRRRLAATISSSLDAVIVSDATGKVVDWNGAASSVFGISRNDAIGANVDKLVIPERFRDSHQAGMKNYLETGETRVIHSGRVKRMAMRSDGSEFQVEVAIGTADGENGPIFITYLRDISSRVAAEQALLTSRDAAMAADRAKSEFLAVMSHEMRTPLNGVLGVLDLLDKTGLDDQQQRFVDVATSSGEILLRHINDVLDISRTEARRMTFVDEPIELDILLNEALDVSRPMAEARGNEMALIIDPEIPPLRGDAHRIRQIVLNLLGNAAKFTRDGRIGLEAELIGQSGGSVELGLYVADTGPGVAPEDRERIFQNFVTLDASYERETSGSGLGLAIVRRLAEAMGGGVTVEDAPGGGSLFRARLLLALDEEERVQTIVEPEREPERAQLPPMRILLVEDNAVNRLVVVESLKGGGHHIVEASDGVEGLAAAANERFDLILMDISMPRLNGVEATRVIRNGSGPNRVTPIVGITAHAMPDEYRRFAAAGMVECLTKPIRAAQLTNSLARALASGKEEAQEIDEDDEDSMIDEEVLSEFAGAVSPDILSRTLERVINEVEEAREQLEQMIAKNRLGELRPVAHRAAGGAAIVGASAVHQSLSRMEAASVREDADEARAALAALDAVTPDTFAILRDFIASAEAEA